MDITKIGVGATATGGPASRKENMPDDKAGGTSVSTGNASLDVFLKALDTQVEHATTAATGTVVSAADVAQKYAKLAPGQKPSYLGIFLVALSIAIELVRGVFNIQFSEDMLKIMLISGIITLIAGSILDVAILAAMLKITNSEEKRAADAQSKAHQSRIEAIKGFMLVKTLPKSVDNA